ncbi:MAG: hypothetical protein RR252_07435 [Longicatena sp.]
MVGHSSEYLEVFVKAQSELLHKMCQVKVTSLEDDVLYGNV